MMAIIDSLTLLGIIVAIIGVPWYLGRRLSRLEHGQSALNKITNGLLGLLGLVIGLLHKRKALDDSELQQILTNYAELAHLPEKASNPLLIGERERLNAYLAKLRRGEFFLPDEVRDYNDLVSKLEQERKGDPDIWPLIALGAFLLGLVLASQKK